MRRSFSVQITTLLSCAFLFISPLFSDALGHSQIAIYAVHCGTGEVLLDKNSDVSLIPSSCMKVSTTGAALHLLSPDRRFETVLEYDGFIDSKGTLHGNLYIRGGGDPCLGSERIFGVRSWKKQIEAWAEAIQKLGILRVEGKVVGDASKWEKALAVPSWSWEDLGNYYGAGASALSFHENAYTLVFKPGDKIGDKTTILRTDPPLPTLVFQNEVTTGPEGSGDNACIYGCEFSGTQFVRGTVPKAVKEFFIRGAIPDPAFCVADMLEKELYKNKISMGHKNFEPGKRTPFHTTYSPCIKEIIHWTNQKSVNLYAEHLLKKMGEVVYKDGSTATGIKAVTEFWKSHKLDLEGANFVDGSGLSRKNLLTAKQLVKMLLIMKQSPHFPIFFDSLPQMEKTMRAKSGTMSLIRGYAGYTNNIAFAVLVNQCPDSKILKETINTLLNQINEAK